MNQTEVLALEVPQFVGEGIRSLVPRLIGWTAEAETAKGTGRERKAWKEETFLAEFEKRDAGEREVAARLIAWAQEQGLRPGWGTGGSYGSFIPYLDLPDDLNLSIFGVWTNGVVEVRFGYWGPARPPFDREDKRREYVERLNRIPGVALPESLKTHGVSRSFPIAALLPEESLSEFLRVVGWAFGELRAAAAPAGVAGPIDRESAMASEVDTRRTGSEEAN